MGRWSQRQRRGGGESLAVVPDATVLSVVDYTGFSVKVTFSAPVAVDNGVPPDTAFTVNGAAPSSVSLDSPTVVVLNLGGPDVPGDPWDLSAQPNWLLTAVQVPEAGLVA